MGMWASLASVVTRVFDLSLRNVEKERKTYRLWTRISYRMLVQMGRNQSIDQMSCLSCRLFRFWLSTDVASGRGGGGLRMLHECSTNAVRQRTAFGPSASLDGGCADGGGGLRLHHNSYRSRDETYEGFGVVHVVRRKLLRSHFGRWNCGVVADESHTPDRRIVAKVETGIVELSTDVANVINFIVEINNLGVYYYENRRLDNLDSGHRLHFRHPTDTIDC